MAQENPLEYFTTAQTIIDTSDKRFLCCIDSRAFESGLKHLGVIFDTKLTFSI